MSGLSLLQGILLTQEANRYLLHCRQILYQLSYQGSHYVTLERIPILSSFLIIRALSLLSGCHSPTNLLYTHSNFIFPFLYSSVLTPFESELAEIVNQTAPSE